jgi:glycosyltransferase involved in cell wall biosynthesis
MLGPASQRAASFARELPRCGWDPIVVTVSDGYYHRDERHRPPDVPTVRVRAPEPSRILGTFRGRSAGGVEESKRVTEASFPPALRKARRLVRDYLYIPDGQALWIPFAIRAVRQVLEEVPGPKVLVSTSVPYSSHLAALVVARRERIPWVAEFRDPWSQVDDSIRPRSRVRKAIDRELERRVVQSASALVVTSELTRKAMIACYSDLREEQVWLVRNGFDELDRLEKLPATGPALELVHAGSVPEEVALEPLLRGVDRVAVRSPGSIRVTVFGPPEQWQSAAASGDFPWLRVAGLVPPSDARRAIASASANVLLRPGRHHREYVAAKLMEYLGARRPILAIVDPTGEMAGLGQSYGDMRIVPEYHEVAVAGAVERLLADQRGGVLRKPVQPRSPLEDITRRAQAARLAAALDSVVAHTT